MRSEEEVKELMNELLKIADSSPEDYKTGVHETCEHFVACLYWVLEEVNIEEVTREFLLKSPKGREKVICPSNSSGVTASE